MTVARHVRFVTPRFGAAVIGGAEAIARQVAQQLTLRGWSVEVFTTTALDERTWASELSPGMENDNGISVRRFRVRMARRPRTFHQFSRALFRLPAALRPETAWFFAQGPWAPGLTLALREARPMPTVFVPYLFHPTITGLPLAPHPRILLPAAHAEAPFALRRVDRAVQAADGFWFSTPEERDLMHRVHPTSTRKPYIIGTVGMEPPAGLDADGFRRRHGLSGPLLYYGGRVAPGKGFDILMEGFQALRARRSDVQLLLSGEAGEGDHGDGVVGIGRVSDEERWNAVAAADVVVVPSRFESLSLLALEAWSCGRPCLLNSASPVLAGQAERSGAALLFSTARELTQSAERMLDDPKLANRLGTAGHTFVQRDYTWDAVVERYAGLIAEVTR